jgi:hypothetical protein
MIQHIQDSILSFISGQPANGSTTTNFASTTTVGNFIAVMIEVGNTQVGVTYTCSDPVNGTYQQIQSTSVTAPSLAIFYIPNAQSLLSSQNITVTWNGGTAGQVYISTVASEFSGVVSSNPLNAHNENTGTGTRVSGGVVTPNLPGCVFISVAGNATGSTANVNPPWTTIINASVGNGVAAYFISIDINSQEATWTMPSFAWSGLTGAFSPVPLNQGLAATGNADYQWLGGEGNF